jgi:hypothetical protein
VLGTSRYLIIPHYTDRRILASIKMNALTLSFSRGHRNGNVPYLLVGAIEMAMYPII